MLTTCLPVVLVLNWSFPFRCSVQCTLQFRVVISWHSSALWTFRSLIIDSLSLMRSFKPLISLQALFWILNYFNLLNTRVHRLGMYCLKYSYYKLYTRLFETTMLVKFPTTLFSISPCFGIYGKQTTFKFEYLYSHITPNNTFCFRIPPPCIFKHINRVNKALINRQA